MCSQIFLDGHHLLPIDGCGDFGGAWLSYAQLCDNRHTGHAATAILSYGLVFHTLQHAAVRRDHKMVEVGRD